MGEWCVKDICGYVCVFFTYFTLFVVDMGVVFFSLPQRLLAAEPLAIFHVIVFNCIIFTISLSHIKCMTTNPGTVPRALGVLSYRKFPETTKTLVEQMRTELAAEAKPKGGRKSNAPGLLDADLLSLENLEAVFEKRNKQNQTRPHSLHSLRGRGGKKFNTSFDDHEEHDEDSHSESEDEDSVVMMSHMSRSDQILKILARRCKKCDCVKPPKSHHCSTCGRCVARMDHHCPWVNNCVGYYNQKHFLLFMFYVVVGCIYAGVLFYFRVRHCNKLNKFCGILTDLKMLVLALLNVFLMLLFVLFCVVMTSDQINCIVTEQSTIDKLSKEKSKRQRSAMQNLERVFGGPFGLDWFLPTSLKNQLVVEQEY